jgi:hypothetical protein
MTDLFSPFVIDPADWIKRTLVERGQLVPPAHFYRFLSLGRPGKGRSSLVRLLLKEQVYLSARERFNDVFDSRVTITYSNDEKLWKLSEAALQMSALGVGPLRAQRNVRNTGMVYRDSDLVQKAVDQQLDRMGICCFSDDVTSTTQWYHYGDRYRGVAVEIAGDPFSGEFPMLPIRYGEECFNFRYPEDSLESVFFATAHKHTDWKYEREWRLILIKAAGTFFSLRRGAVVRVILGMRSTERTKRMVTKLLRLRAKTGLPPVAVVSTRMRSNGYGIACELPI